MELNVIDEESWRSYYRNFWYEGKNSEEEIYTDEPNELGGISFEEVIDAVKAIK